MSTDPPCTCWQRYIAGRWLSTKGVGYNNESEYGSILLKAKEGLLRDFPSVDAAITNTSDWAETG